MPEYKSYNENGGCTGFSQNRINNVDNAYVLTNGQIIILYQNGANDMVPLFLVDINGHKGPNAYGKDLFAFMINKQSDSGLYTNSGICDFPVSGGRTTREMVQYALAGKK